MWNDLPECVEPLQLTRDYSWSLRSAFLQIRWEVEDALSHRVLLPLYQVLPRRWLTRFSPFALEDALVEDLGSLVANEREPVV